MARGEKEQLKKDLRKVTGKLNHTTKLLCSVLRDLPDSEVDRDPELAAWWKKHKAADEKRRAREEAKRREAAEKRRKKAEKKRLKSRALAKLTDAEVEALGLKE